MLVDLPKIYFERATHMGNRSQTDSSYEIEIISYLKLKRFIILKELIFGQIAKSVADTQLSSWALFSYYVMAPYFVFNIINHNF